MIWPREADGRERSLRAASLTWDKTTRSIEVFPDHSSPSSSASDPSTMGARGAPRTIRTHSMR
jgi:hypothetical protein